MGEEIVIAKAGRPIARLVPCTGVRAERALGRYAGQGYIADDFDAPMRDVEDAFYRG
jgi:antitoxin (DNA-binding transcriptional repressor) of toxin-antitoxin stability system